MYTSLNYDVGAALRVSSHVCDAALCVASFLVLFFFLVYEEQILLRSIVRYGIVRFEERRMIVNAQETYFMKLQVVI